MNLSSGKAKYCAEFIGYSSEQSYLTCPASSNCPNGGNFELDLKSLNKSEGVYSYSWKPETGDGSREPISICKSTIRTDVSNSIINLDFENIEGRATIVLFIMTKDKFKYTNRKYRIESDSLFKKFSINGWEDEYKFYVIPNKVNGNSFKIKTWLEKAQGSLSDDE